MQQHCWLALPEKPSHPLPCLRTCNSSVAQRSAATGVQELPEHWANGCFSATPACAPLRYEQQFLHQAPAHPIAAELFSHYQHHHLRTYVTAYVHLNFHSENLCSFPVNDAYGYSIF